MSRDRLPTISADLEFRSALESFRRGDHADAERRMKAATQAEPRHAGALNLLGALLDTALYTRRLGAAFEAMHARRFANLPPDAIHVPA